MTIRKITYNISYIHILTFREHYKSIIAPYFEYEPLRYGIDDENTRNESIRLIFENEGFIIHAKKEGLLFMYEGEISDVKKNNPIIDIFFEIFEKIKNIDGFAKTKRHELITDAVAIVEEEAIHNYPNYLYNPFGKLKEYATIFEFEKEAKKIRFQFGNFSDSDIKKQNISPLNTDFNKELIGKIGLMCQVNIKEDITNSSFTKFKNVLKESETIIENYINHGR